jgi:hypothetical protein
MAPMQARAGAPAPRERTSRRRRFDPYDATTRPGDEYVWAPVYVEAGVNVPSRWRFRWVREAELDDQEARG